MKFQITFRQQWLDPRLRYNLSSFQGQNSVITIQRFVLYWLRIVSLSRNVDYDITRRDDTYYVVLPCNTVQNASTCRDIEDLIWTPDTFFRNSVDVKAHGLPTPNAYARVEPDGTVTLSQRL